MIKKAFKQILTRLSKKEQLAFLQNLASLVEDGVNLKDGINTIAVIAKGYEKKIAIAVNNALAKGKGLADGLQSWYPNIIIEMIRAGENSGALSQAVLSAAKTLQHQSTVRKQLLVGLTYPSIILSLTLLMLVVIKETVLKNFTDISPVSEWPKNGASLFYFAQFIEYWWWAILIMLLTILWASYHFLHHFTGTMRNTIDKLPLFSMYRHATAARFLKTLGLLISNGIIIKNALNIISQKAPPYLGWHILVMEYNLSGGIDNIAEVLDTQLLPSSELVRLKVVAQGKGFAAALISIGQQYQDRNEKQSAVIAKVIGGLLMLSGATIAANIIFGIYAIGSTLH